MKPRLIVFDLDGTLADTSPGIINSHKFANLKMGRQVPDDETLAKVIGGPLLETYKKKFSYSDSDAVEAVRIYRERYATHGINEVEIYSEIPELLKELKSRGFTHGPHDLVEPFRRGALEEGILLAGGADTVDHLIALQVAVHHLVNGIDIVLKVGVHGDGGVALALDRHESRHEGVLMALVAGEADAAEDGVGLMQVADHLPGAVLGAVVDENDLAVGVDLARAHESGIFFPQALGGLGFPVLPEYPALPVNCRIPLYDLSAQFLLR